MSKATGYTRLYSDFRGVELGGSGSEISKSRLAYAENVYRDYDGDGGGIIESVPGFRRIASFGKRIHSIVRQSTAEDSDYLLIHAGTSLYRMRISERDSYLMSDPIEEMPDKKCPHFSVGGSVFFVTGDYISEITRDGAVLRVGEEGAMPYIPSLTLNGAMHEQRNLLTDKLMARYIIADPREYFVGTKGLVFTVTDESIGVCAVSGMDRYYEGEIYVPGYTTLHGRQYRVTEIFPHAFSLCDKATAIYVAEGVEVVGEWAFNFCSSAKVISLPRTVREIGIAVFEDCVSMTDVYLGVGLTSIPVSAFVECKELKNVHYGGTAEQLESVEGNSVLDGYNLIFNSEDIRARIELAVPEDSREVLSITENGKEIEFEQIFDNEGRLSAVRLVSTSIYEEPCNYLIEISGAEKEYSFGDADVSVPGKEAILGCTLAEVFDNRVFLSGNPTLPNTVFYSTPISEGGANRLYFGAMSYFSDGIGGYGVSALLAAGDSLAVFKKGDDGSGSIFYHTPTSTDSDYLPRVYPKSYIHSGISAVGEAFSFMDDPVFITKLGLYALDKRTINYDRNVVCRSHNVNYSLLNEALNRAILTEWCGYLVILTGSTAYLADSRMTFTHRTGGREYEWFVLTGIGSYEGDSTVYRFDSFENGDIKAHPSEGDIFLGDAISEVDNDGRVLLYGIVDGIKYSLYKTGERRGGVFSPACCALGVEDLLFFGTESGALMVFNNDKRGIAPDNLRGVDDFDPLLYADIMGRRIHPEYYSHDGHAVRYAIKTAYDNCDIPHLAKSTVKHSLVLKCRSYSDAPIHCEVGTESSDYSEITSFPMSPLSFSEVNLGSLALSVADYQTLPIAEKEKGWIEKQIALYTEGYAAPIGVASIAYRYTVKGRIKRS